ncbi:MAG: ABC transporter permease [Ardenticatenales bacterium]|nr:ABC transporter permease [Ardenticatenales bacterium]
MLNYWLVMRHEYRRMVARRAFLLTTLAIPLGFSLLIGLVIAVELARENKQPIGYVDNAHILDESLQATVSDAEKRIHITAFPDEASALDALRSGQVQAVFVFPPDYPGNRVVDLYYERQAPGNSAWGDFDDFVRVNLVRNMPANYQTRLLDGPHMIVEDTVSGRQFSEQGVVNIILPIVGSIFFFVATMTASGYMLRVVADEKENRTMEIMLTSITPRQLIGGKALGLLAAALTQLGIYLITVIIALKVATPYVPELQGVQVPWAYLGVMGLFFFPAYGLISAIMVAIGSAVTEFQQGQQIAGLLNFLFIIPMLVLPALLQSPNSPLVTFLSLFPTSAFLTISLRWGLGTVPTWQLVASWIILVGTTIVMIAAAARVFRAGMLHYGQPLNLRSVMAALRG